jgi:hypothetical protein
MYIITKKKDFYDGVVGTMGIDKTIVYNRETQIFEDRSEFPKAFRPNNLYNTRWQNHFLNVNHYQNFKNNKYSENHSFIVGFCGKLYIGWKFYREVPDNNGYSDMETYITYDREFVKKNVKTVGWHSNLMDDLNYIDTYNSMDIFRNLKVPIFIYDNDYNRTSINAYRSKSVFITNPILNDYEFYKVFDSFAAFQEVQMFMGGVLGSGEKEIIEVEDKYKITEHGFDKYSFRKDKEDGSKKK